MNSNWQRRLSAIWLGFGGIMILYLSFKFTGDGLPHPSPLMLPWNILDFVVMKLLYFLLFAVPTAGVLFLVHLYISSMIDRRCAKADEELSGLRKKFERQTEKMEELHRQESKRQEQAIRSLWQEIQAIKDREEAKTIPVASIEVQTLNNFL
ncbi:MAG: hypothetical protein AABY86_14510 [Bdellovibrionota bacterium]